MSKENKKKRNEKTIRRIDHSQIKNGEIIFIGGVYNSKGNYLKSIPHIERTKEEIEKENANQFGKIDVSEFSEKAGRFIPLSIREILDMKLPKNPFLVEKLIPHKSICILSGEPGSCKSWILLYLSKCITSGKPFFEEFKTKKGSVLIIEEESGIEEIQRRLRLLKFRRKSTTYVMSQKNIKIDIRLDIENLIKLIKGKNIELVIFDPFVAIHSKVENSADEMQKVMDALQEITLAGTSIILAHHHRKEIGFKRTGSAQSLRGFSAIFARLDSYLMVEKIERDDEIILNITHIKSRKGKTIPSFSLRFIEKNGKVTFEVIERQDKRKIKLVKNETLILDILKELKKSTFNEIYEEVKEKMGENKLRGILKNLRMQGKINFKKVAHGKEVFGIKDS